MNPSSHPFAERASQFNRYAHTHPGRTLCAAIGVGLLAGFLVRAWSPRPARAQAIRLLADLHGRLHEVATPIRREADHLLAAGAAATTNGAAQLRQLHLDRGLRRLFRRCQNLFR